MSFTVCALSSPALFALIDCNNFFVSCERVFNPSLTNKPVIVLSGNDGCAIARSNQAKDLGVAMGAPLHTFSHLINPHDIRIFSSNFELYGDLSNRMINILQTFTPDVEVYSIDEAFIDLSPLPCFDYAAFAQKIHNTLLKHIGIPVTIGIAPTKTLAKMANRVAKKIGSPFTLLQSAPDIENALRQTAVSDIWGIGRALAPKLKKIGLYTAYDLARKDPRWARSVMGVTGERLVREIQGIACIPFNAVEDDQKSIQVTRSFGVRLTEFNDIAEAISGHATRLGESLRKKKLVTPTISVFCRTSPFGNAPYYKGIGVTGFDTLTQDTQTLIRGAIKALQHAFRPGHAYQSAGIYAMDLVKEGRVAQKSLFDIDLHQKSSGCTPSNAKRGAAVNKAIDEINQRIGKDTLFWASSGIYPRHVAKQNRRSSRYTTRWDEIKLII